MVSENDLHEQAYRLFGSLLARSDPGRLAAWAEFGLTITQLRVLYHLRAEDGLPAGTLADRLDTTPSTLTRIMDRLVQSHLVRRDVDDGDRRLVRHRLTDPGLRTIQEAESAFRSRMDRVLAHLTVEQLERVVLALGDLTAASEAIESGAAVEVGT